MAQYRLTPRAKSGLRKNLEYIKHNFGRDVASKIRRRYVETFAFLAANPELGHLREDLNPTQDIRLWPLGPAIIAYREHAEVMEILAIERAARNWNQILDELDLPLHPLK